MSSAIEKIEPGYRPGVGVFNRNDEDPKINNELAWSCCDDVRGETVYRYAPKKFITDARQQVIRINLIHRPQVRVLIVRL